MEKVTALRSGKGAQNRVSVFLNGRFSFSLEAELVAKENLQVGRELSESDIEALTDSDRLYRCLNAAAHYLSYRPRSEAELKERLQRRGFDEKYSEAAIAKLKEQGLVDDTAFAQFWRDNRQSFSPRSQRLTRLELRQKGVNDKVIDQVVAIVDDDDNAYRVAKGKLRSLPRDDYQSFRRRLGGYLSRRGFGYGIINQTVRRLWQEQTNYPK